LFYLNQDKVCHSAFCHEIPQLTCFHFLNLLDFPAMQ
jgi:hypothetical protein